MFPKRVTFMTGLAISCIAAFVGCSDSETTDADGGAGGTSSDGGAAGGPVGPGAGGMGGMGGAGGMSTYVPTPEDINFVALNPIPSGEQILFNDWAAPDTLLSMQPDGSAAVEIFRAFRIWSVGVARGGDQLAFASGDPQQEEHYGLTVGDSIQHSFLYDFATESASLLAAGNINDECHHFSPNDDAVYLCRRQNFMPDGSHETYRLGRIDLSDLSFTYLVDADPAVLWLSPQVTDAGDELWFTRIQISGGSQTRAIGKMALPDGAPEVVKSSAHPPLLSPGGSRYMFADSAQNSALYESDLNGDNPVLVADVAGTDVTYSPDGTQVAFLVFDQGASCSHVHVAAVDGSDSADPPVIRDCTQSGEFITALSWITRP